ncbi:AAA family ATPase, CDC48 subfamily [Clostridium sp. DL-VIII]|uniref:CDC48 family AAA ATPase n=1 Tax=Clostridium sp. DL-VIII TaxID=641107 RepID=UPI00023B0015|nr:CDC48 family AAA ATPase [Clostridium sp. DL-VIII]EHI98555.1 AAA family ATPase, CDC48 subfamily [Clostridium sp. DL-VIII]
MSDNENKYTLKVAEALVKDVGKAIVRIDPKDIIKIGAAIGDIVKLTGKNIAVARVLPIHQQYKGQGLVQMDGILRKNAGVGVDENIEIELVSSKNANVIELSSISKKSNTLNNEDLKHIKNAMEGIPVFKGNTLRVKLLGYSYQDYTVISTEPEGAVTINEATILKVKKEGIIRKENGVSYEDIGGLESQIEKIREMIELPLKYPEVFDRLGIEAPRGVLLYGSPGTGKTLIARAVANETNVFFIHVNGPEIVNKYYGESEAKLREIFENASNNAPSIIFLDEIDAISPKRENSNGDVEKRIVAQLLALMDGLKDRGQVIVIGATNLPNSIDPALRRPGRFDREIEVGIPDKNSRLKILNVHTRDMPLSETVELDKLAELTHGFVGADLQALCREAAMTALRKIFPQIDFSTSNIPYDKISTLKVTMDDFYKSLQDIEPSAIREVFVDIPNVRFDDIGGLQNIKDEITRSIVWPTQYEELYKKFGCRAPKGIIFHGLPGTGKTLMAKAIASLNNANFISVKGPELLSKWVGESEKGLREIFKKAKQAAPCVIFFDEIDSIVPARGRVSDGSATERMLCQMLTEIDGVEDLNGVLILGATNRLDIIDPALLRPGRFGMTLEFKEPTLEERIEILKIHLKGKPIADDVDLIELAEATDGFTGADIMEICQKAALEALADYIYNVETDDSNEKPAVIKYVHFKNIIKSR